MKVVIWNLLDNSSRIFEGDVTSIERQLDRHFPWAVRGNEGNLEMILWTIDHSQYRAVEIADKALHPFLEVGKDK